MRRLHLPLSVCLSAAVLVSCALLLPAQAQQRREANRVVSTVDTLQHHMLRGHIPGWASSTRDLGAVSSDITIEHLTVVLARSAASQAAFEQLLADQQNPGSARYQQWLTPQQVGEQFGPTDHDVTAVTQWLASQGLRVDSVSPSRLFVNFSGASSSVSRALSTQFHRYAVQTRNGIAEKISIDSEPAVPAALSSVIAAFDGLSDDLAEPQSIAKDVALPQTGSVDNPSALYTTSASSHYTSPADFVTIFDIKPVYNAGINGTGVKVAVIGRSRVLASDITSFQTNTNLSTTAQPNTILPGADPGPAVTGTCTVSSCADQGEQTLDVNRVMSTAPGAQVDLVINSSLGTAIQYEISTLVDPIMTISYGACESGVSSSAVATYNSLFSTAAAEGITTFVSSGDSSAAGCTIAFTTPPSTTPVRSINYLCSSEYVTCVGGTEFADTASPSTYWNSSNATGLSSAIGYIPEGAWNEPTTTSGFQIAGTGGGASLYLAKPTWQTGTGVPADGVRDTPDVSFPSAEHDGYYSCLQGSCNTSGHFTVFSGTSAAAPGMAGMMALVVQKLGHAQGNFNATFYRLAGTSGLNVFHDATPATSGVATCALTTASMCNNSTPSLAGLTGGLAGYALTTGYDLATGLGSIDVNNLITGVSATFTVGNGTPISLTAGATTGNTSVVAVTSLNGFAGTVTLSCGISASATVGGANVDPTCSLSPASVTLTSGSSTNVTLTVTTATHTSGAAGTSASGYTTFGVLTVFLLLALPFAGRRRLPAVMAFVLLAAGMATMSGCGSGGSSAAAPANGTLHGTYIFTISGTSGANTAGGTVTLTVN